jgi:DNA invertase Pin-like site-specific DNA recombinase
MNTNKRAIIYIRVSTQGQADDGVSLDSQKEMAYHWCKLSGYHFDNSNVFIDAGVTGTSTAKRVEFQRALDAAQTGDAFIVYSISRFGRSAVEVLQNAAILENKGVDFVSLSEKTDTTTPQGKFFFLLMAGLAQLTSDTIKADTKRNMQFKKERGELVGSVPYGFDAVPTGKKSDKTGREVKTLTPNDYEQSVITRIKILRNANPDKLLSFQKIAYALKSEGFKTRKGGTEWHATSIERILKAV